MSYVGACILVVGFLACFQLLGATRRAQEVFVRARQSLADLRDPQLDDDTKEKRLQAHSLRLFALFFLLVLISAVALAVPAAAVFGLELAGVGTLQEAVNTTLSIPFLVITSVVITLAVVVVRKLRA